jgi:hypothetical protein
MRDLLVFMKGGVLSLQEKLPEAQWSVVVDDVELYFSHDVRSVEQNRP